MNKPKLIVFASGTKDGGGSGFENLVHASWDGILDAEIVAVVSNNEHGGVHERANRLGIHFVYFSGPYDAGSYERIVANADAEWVALSGWLKHVKGLDPARTFNIHPTLLSEARFAGLYGQKVHQAVADALEKGEMTESGLSMHFVTDEYDRGPIFFEYRVPLKKGMSAEEIAKAVNVEEHRWQPKITNMVVHGEIRWDGKDSQSLNVPGDYKYLPRLNA
ncbi:MAG: hypothetical protein UY63_C0006G0008 [Parcubacteria group bacterium GW2011_GWA2_51_10]|nr:MAG: hypothetical protein UY63_C0006G0008 [Parcubacteria group bacterium GW2011_GWA2_51_10]